MFRYVPVDGQLIPLGKLVPVDGTVFDFQTGRSLGPALTAGGLDHWLVFDPPRGSPQAVLADEASGR